MKASAISGKNVPQKITAARPTSSRLLTRKIASRESSESIRRSERRIGSAADDQRRRTDQDHDRDQAEERRPDGRGAERVDRLQHARAHQEGAEQREREGGDDQATRSRPSASRGAPGP